MVRRGPRSGGVRAERDGGVHGGSRRPAVVADGPAQGLLRRGVRVLHQPALAQGRRADRRAARCALLFPWHPLERQVRVEGAARSCRPRRVGVLRQPATRLPARRPRLPPVPGGRLARRARRRRTPAPRGPTPTRCPSRTSGAATGCGPRSWSSGRAGPAGCTTDLSTGVRHRPYSGWRTERLAPSVTPMSLLERESALRAAAGLPRRRGDRTRPGGARGGRGRGRQDHVRRRGGRGGRCDGEVALGRCDGSATPAPLGPLGEMLAELPDGVWPAGGVPVRRVHPVAEALADGRPRRTCSSSRTRTGPTTPRWT